MTEAMQKDTSIPSETQEQEEPKKADHESFTGEQNDDMDEELKIAVSNEEGPIHQNQKESTETKDAGVDDEEFLQFPSLYEECRVMLTGSILIYGIAELRRLIRLGKISDPRISEPFMTMPIRAHEVLPVAFENRELFQRTLGSENSFYLDYIIKELAKDANFQVGPPEDPPPQMKPADKAKAPTDTLLILEMHDSSDKEIVYSIVLDHACCRIKVVFRGSVTARDFFADADPHINWYPNPVPSIRGDPQDKRIGIHMGFAAYLNETPAKLGEGKTKKIKERLLALHNEYPNYRLYCTGHSLGGALATLMAFELATTENFPKPVTLVSIAAPKVGNIGFLHAVQALEKMGDLRCIRVANKYDIVPSLPTKACCCVDVCCCCCCCLTTMLQNRRYWHVGAKIKLYKDGTCDISYARRRLTYQEQLQDEMSRRGRLKRAWKAMWRAGTCGRGDGDFLQNHSCEEYTIRLTASKEKLDSIHLEELYVRQSRQSIKSMTHGKA